MDICGTCVYYQIREEEIGGGRVTTEICTCDLSNLECGYGFKACSEYMPDYDYINFLKGESNG